LYSLLYPCMLYVYFAPVKHKAQWGRLIPSLTWFDWSHKYWRLPATKVHVRELILSGVRNPTWRANLSPPWVGEKYSLTSQYAYFGGQYREFKPSFNGAYSTCRSPYKAWAILTLALAFRMPCTVQSSFTN
jgi:hypothetical protein